MNHALLPLKGRYRLQPQLWNALISKTMIQEQLHQRDAGPNNHGEEQKGTSTERRDREEPKGSNASCRQERQDTSCSSIVDMAPPHMVAEMKIMKERMDFVMNALEGRVSNDLDELVHRSPFQQSSICHRQKPMISQRIPWITQSHSKLSCTYKVFRMRSYAELSQLH